MPDPIRVMLERGKKKRVVAVAFDWPGWDRSVKTEDGALQVLDRGCRFAVFIAGDRVQNIADIVGITRP